MAATRQVVAAAAHTGAVVEGEQLAFSGRSTVHAGDAEANGACSTPDGARRFVDATGIDIYAAAIGNVHRRYVHPVPLDLDLLADLRDVSRSPSACTAAAACPTTSPVRSPGAGSPRSTSTPMCATPTGRHCRRELDTHPDEYATVKLVEPVIAAVQAEVEAKIRAFGSAGTASR